MSASILPTSIYTYPIPSWADGTPLFVGPTTPHAIDEICKAYADKFGTSGDSAPEDKTYYAQLKAALGILKEILDGYDGIDTSSAEKLRTTFGTLKTDKFYTAAQTINGNRIDENCREGLLAYRHYLKTIVSALDRVYGYLEDGRQALEALEDETDSDIAHTLITQLEIDEQFIYEEFQALRTHYKYNADTKQWDKEVDDDFKTQLGELSAGRVSRDSNGNLIDRAGKRIVQIADDAHTVRKYYQLSDDGKSLSNTESTPVTDVLWVYLYGSEKFGFFWINNTFPEEGAWYKFDDNNKPIPIAEAPTGYPDQVLGHADADGDKVIEVNGVYYKADSQDQATGIPAKLFYLKDNDGFLLNTSKERIMQVDNDWYQLDDREGSEGKLTMVKSLPYANLQDLRDVQISYHDSTKTTDPKSALTVFNSVTLLDRLRYIRYYYKLILQFGATDYSVFPNSAETGYPCLPDVKSTEATQDTKNLGALEVFYVGYLIDRDGPINAVSSFFEVKTAALRNNLSLQSQKITALNMYLDFINRGMDVLNQSQSNGKKRIPDGAHNALTYLCGEKMYNLFEKDGVKYLVIPCTEKSKEDVNVGKFRLIRADDSGKAFLLGTDGEPLSAKASIWIPSHEDDKGQVIIDHIDMYDNSGAVDEKIPEADKRKYKDKEDEPVKYKYVAPSQAVIDGKDTIFAYYIKGKDVEGKDVVGYELVDDFVLPTQLEVSTIIPGSVKGYAKEFMEDPKDRKDQDHTAMIESWTNALSNKTQYINTAIDTINTDVSVDRSKIDTFDSLTSTFRSRAQDVYLNTAANIRG